MAFESVTGKLAERLREYCAYYLIDPDISTVDKNVEKLSGVLESMLQSDDPRLWSRAALLGPGLWSAAADLASVASLNLGKGAKLLLSAESLGFQILD